MSKILKCILKVLLVILLIIFMVLAIKKTIKEHIYLKDYFSVVNYGDNLSYENIISQNGKITIIKTSDTVECAYCPDGRVFIFNCSSNGQKSLIRVDVTNAQYIFGRKNIAVGSTKDSIEKTYKYNTKRYITPNWLEVVDGQHVVSFYLDQNQNVEKITIGYVD